VRLLLIRHGQIDSNVEHRLDTVVPGPALNRVGLREADKLSGVLAGEPIGAIYSSTLDRARMTAEPLARRHGLTVRVRSELKEISAGDLESRDDQAAHDHYHRIVFGWAEGRTDIPVPGGSDGVQFLTRFDAVIDEIAGLNLQSVAVIGHGAAIRVWVSARSGNLTPVWAAGHGLPNTAVVELHGTPDTGWTVRRWAGEVLSPESAPLSG
jgi:probable phosphoglycerate mutase